MTSEHTHFNNTSCDSLFETKLDLKALTENYEKLTLAFMATASRIVVTGRLYDSQQKIHTT
jgi:hypothetical protein